MCGLFFFFQYKIQQINRESIFQAVTMEFTRSQEARCHNEHVPLLTEPPRWVVAITEPLLASSAAHRQAGRWDAGLTGKILHRHSGELPNLPVTQLPELQRGRVTISELL